MLESSDPQLVRSFEWAKERALGYTYTGYAVGNWYDSTGGSRMHSACATRHIKAPARRFLG